jgi:hypothetical protein
LCLIWKQGCFKNRSYIFKTVYCMYGVYWFNQTRNIQIPKVRPHENPSTQSYKVTFQWQNEIISLWKRASSQLETREVSRYFFLTLTSSMQETDQCNIK